MRAVAFRAAKAAGKKLRTQIVRDEAGGEALIIEASES